jgi:hypothetical protein
MKIKIIMENFRRGIRETDNPEGNEEFGEFKVFHKDHGITEDQFEYIKRFLKENSPQGFSIQTIQLPSNLGSAANALYGPASGDQPVGEEEVEYIVRGDRPYPDRMINKPMRPTQEVQVIGVREGEDFTIYTAHGGPLAPQNPKDPNNRDVEAAKTWWSQHALSTEQ